MSYCQLESSMERNENQKVADYLCVSYEEYVALEPSVEEQVGDDDLVACYLVTFGKPIPAVVAAKMKGLSGGQVALPPGFFEADEPEWPQG